MPRDQPTAKSHVWHFFRAGGFDQVRLAHGSDVAALDGLDQKLWVALACPTRGVEFDERTLDLIDADHDGRIRAPEILDAARWTTSVLKHPEDLAKSHDQLALSVIDPSNETGKRILASAHVILGMLGKGEAETVSLDDTGRIWRILDAEPANGDGIVPARAGGDAETIAALDLVIAREGPETDRAGLPGVSQATSDRFFDAVAAYAAWWDEAAVPDSGIRPLGDDTAAGAAHLDALKAKLDDYFTRCRLAAFDPQAAVSLNPQAAAYLSLAPAELDAARDEVRALPLAHIEAGRALPLAEGTNPAWAAELDDFRRTMIVPVLGERDRLTEGDWRTLDTAFQPYRAWLGRKPVNAAAGLDIAEIRPLLASGVKAKIDGLLAADRALTSEVEAISEVEKLIRYQRDLLPFLNNVVSFRDFYTRTGKGIFQAGTLYLDGRSCELCVRVENEAKHAELATLSRVYLAYCICTREGGAKRMTIAAAFTAGDADNLRVGRNGVFYDRRGQDWDATIFRIIEHPISLRQAFWLPYKQAARMIGELIQKMAAARAANNQSQMLARTTVAAETGTVVAPPPPPAAFDAARFAGIFAAIGLALGAFATAISATVTGFVNLSWWQMPLAVLAIILVISGPSLVIAALKLRSRNLGPILDACGWAVNTRLRINIPFGRALTALSRMPDGAQRSLADPYAEKRRPWGLYLFVIVVLGGLGAAWYTGHLHR